MLSTLATSEMAFGGVGESGMGGYHGKDGFDAFSHYKSIVDKRPGWICRCDTNPFSLSYMKIATYILEVMLMKNRIMMAVNSVIIASILVRIIFTKSNGFDFTLKCICSGGFALLRYHQPLLCAYNKAKRH